MAGKIVVRLENVIPREVHVGSKLKVVSLDNNEITFVDVSENITPINDTRLEQRRKAKKQLRKIAGSPPLDLTNYKPLTKDEIHGEK